MNFKTLTVEQFKIFKQASFSFYDGINVIKGRNESGKSSILEAIQIALFTSARTKSKKLFERITRWQNSRAPRLELTFEENAQEYLLTRDFEKGESSLTLKGKETLQDEEKIFSQIASVAKVYSEKMFSSTALVNQYEVSQVTTDSELIEALHKMLITGGKSDVSLRSIIKMLEKKIKTYSHGIDRLVKDPGSIVRLQAKIDEFTTQIEEQRQEAKEKERAVEKVRKLNKTISNLENTKELLETQLSATTNLREGEEELLSIDNEIKQIEKRLHKIKSLTQERQEVDEKIKREFPWDTHEFEHDVRAVAVIQNQIESFTNRGGVKQPQRLQHSKVDLIEPLHNLFTGEISRWPAILLVLGVISGSFTASFSVETGIGIIIASIIITYVIAYSLGRVAHKVSHQAQESDLSNLQHELQIILGKYNVSHPPAFMQLETSFRATLRKQESLSAQLEGVTFDATQKQLVDEQISLLTKKKEEESLLTDEIKSLALESGEFAAKKKELETTVKDLEKAKNSHAMEKAIAVRKSTHQQDIEQQEYELERVKKQLLLEEKELEMYNLVQVTLESSAQALSKTVIEKIEGTIESYLPILTQKRYQKIRFSKEYEIQVYSNEKKDWIHPEDTLSTGTIEQIYFLLRIIFLDILTGSSGIPLLLDDTFISFDAQRQKSALSILKKISDYRQIVLFTCHDDFDEWGNLIEISP